MRLWLLGGLLAARGLLWAAEPLRGSIYHVSYARDGAAVAVLSAGSLVPLALEQELIHPRCPCDPGEVNGFDRGVIGNHSDVANRLADVTVVGALAAPAALDYADEGWSRPWVEDMLVYAEVLSATGAGVTIAKYGAQRPLPRTYENNDAGLLSEPRGYRAFYSGHTSFTFAALSAGAMTWTRRHGPSPWPWIATGALGTSVAAEKILAGSHFYSDVLVGAATGLLFGIGIPKLHERGPGEWSVSAGPGRVVLLWKRRF